MLCNPEIKIKGVEGIISEIKLLNEPNFGESVKFKTLSPIIVRKPVEENGKLKARELYPIEREFYERLTKNS